MKNPFHRHKFELKKINNYEHMDEKPVLVCNCGTICNNKFHFRPQDCNCKTTIEDFKCNPNPKY